MKAALKELLTDKEVTTAFIAGGLFFSAAAAFAGAVYTYGEENVRYGLKLVRRMILRSWELFVAGLGAAKDEFLTPGAGRKRWRKAWNRIGSGVLDARKAARERPHPRGDAAGDCIHRNQEPRCRRLRSALPDARYRPRSN